MIKAIPTIYGNQQFRSRLEAKWAVFFDLVGAKWVYEPDGFKTKLGNYLPDFYLPEHDCFVEVKPYFKEGDKECEKWINKGLEVHKITEKPFLFLFGNPNLYPTLMITERYPNPELTHNVIPLFGRLQKRYGNFWITAGSIGYFADDDFIAEEFEDEIILANSYNFR